MTLGNNDSLHHHIFLSCIKLKMQIFFYLPLMQRVFQSRCCRVSSPRCFREKEKADTSSHPLMRLSNFTALTVDFAGNTAPQKRWRTSSVLSHAMLRILYTNLCEGANIQSKHRSRLQFIFGYVSSLSTQTVSKLLESERPDNESFFFFP